MKVRHENGLQGASTSQVHLEVVPESEVARIPTEASGDNVSRFANLSTTAVVGPSGISNFGDVRWACALPFVNCNEVVREQ